MKKIILSLTILASISSFGNVIEFTSDNHSYTLKCSNQKVIDTVNDSVSKLHHDYFLNSAVMNDSGKITIEAKRILVDTILSTKSVTAQIEIQPDKGCSVFKKHRYY